MEQAQNRLTNPLQQLQQQPSGLSRIVNFARSLSMGAIGITGLVLVLEAYAPEGHHPSDLIGKFHGNTQTAQLDAERVAQTHTASSMANAQAAPQAGWQMETAVNQTQQQVIGSSMETQSSMANIADFACISAGIVGLFAGNANNAELATNAGKVGRVACGVGTNIRDNMTETLSRAARNGTGIMDRNAPAAASRR